MFDIREALVGLVETAVPGIVWKAIPANVRSEGRERLSDWGPFKTISTNHDLVRAVRIAWVNAALRIIDAAEEATRLDEFGSDATSVSEFAGEARRALRRIRMAAFDRSNAPGSEPIDVHARGVLAGTPEFAHPSGRLDIDKQVTDGFVAVLTEIAGAVPELVARIGRDGLKEFSDHPRRSFGELVFSDFAELLKDPMRYPEAMPAFQIYMAGATKELGDQLLGEIKGTTDKLDALSILGANNQRVWLQQFERIGVALSAITEKLDIQQKQSDHQTSLLNAILEQVGGETRLDEQQLGHSWEIFRVAYLMQRAGLWRERFPTGALSDHGATIAEQLTSDALFNLDDPPLIDGQEFKLVIPDGQLRQLPMLKAAKPPTGPGSGGVVGIGFEDIVAGMTGDRQKAAELAAPSARSGFSALRLAFVSSSGVGKSTTLRRLEHEINRRGKGLAIFLEFADIQDAQGSTQENLDLVLPRLLGSMGIPVPTGDQGQNSSVALQVIRYGLARELEQGSLTILIDGLDHVGTTPSAVTHFQQAPMWQRTHVVLSGRPEAFQDWRQSKVSEETNGADLIRWRVIGISEFTEEQARAYLAGFRDSGVAGGRRWRFDMVSRSLGDLLRLPRVLAHLRRLDQSALVRARTAADIYYIATRNLLREGLRGGPRRDERVDRLLGLMGALAFQSMFSGPAGLRQDSARPYPLASAMATLRSRTEPLYAGVPNASLEQDLASLARLSTLIGNGLLESTDNVSDTLRTVSWANRTVSAFLAAYWLARWSSRAPVQQKGVGDAVWFRNALYYPHVSDAEHLYQLNLFLSEMPSECIDPESWVAATSAWYDPECVRGAGRSGMWSTEMLARSWRKMHAIAERPVDDWWDISYETLADTAAGHRSERSFHADPGIMADDPAIEAARMAIDGFLGDFSKLMQNSETPLIDVVAPEGWVGIPAGNYQMGSPKHRQGFPEKTRAFWKEALRRLENSDDLERMAAETSPAWWWTGPQGRRQRKEEVDWLVQTVFRPFREGVARGDRAGAEARALETLRDYFRREDETPEEAEQQVEPFEMAVLPVSNAAFGLFAPGHAGSMRAEVLDNQINVFGGKDRIQELARGWDSPDRPVIYVTWFDAWAFCQWLRWEEDGLRNGCRLPHEAEWEFACKRRRDAEGHSVPSPFEERYWWGDTFYRDDSSFEEEHISKPEAHAIGWPGATRDPAVIPAIPNGFGLKDMIGNVWEWSANIYDQRSESDLKHATNVFGYSRRRPDAEAPHLGASRSMRGGIWYYMNHISTAASRFRGEPDDSDYKIGFRLVRERL